MHEAVEAAKPILDLELSVGNFDFTVALFIAFAFALAAGLAVGAGSLVRASLAIPTSVPIALAISACSGLGPRERTTAQVKAERRDSKQRYECPEFYSA